MDTKEVKTLKKGWTGTPHSLDGAPQSHEPILRFGDGSRVILLTCDMDLRTYPPQHRSSS
jgi:hypothetical protein